MTSEITQHSFLFYFSATLDVSEIAPEAALVAVITVIMPAIKLGDTWPPKRAQRDLNYSQCSYLLNLLLPYIGDT